MKAILVDDEERARRSLFSLLQIHCPGVNVVAQCVDVPNAVLAIKEHQPDIVFLDIDMPNFSGFELVKFFDTINFEIIFVTAYSEHALAAFEISAVDYVLKPVEIDKLVTAVAKAEERIRYSNMGMRLALLQSSLQHEEFQKLALPVRDGLLFVEVNQICMLTADGAYTHVLMRDESSLLVSKKIKFFESHLCKRKYFFRIHRSHIINLNFVKKYDRSDAMVTMDNSSLLSIAKDRKKDFEEAIESIRVGL